MRQYMSYKFLYYVFILIFGSFWSMGCSSSGNKQSNPTVLPEILTQPLSQEISPGNAITFSITASGSQPLTYQWMWNGIPINNAVESTFTIQSTVPADNNSKFSVTVTNSAGKITSNNAILTISGAPRTPLSGDLRFKDVDAFPFGLSPFGSMGQIIAGATFTSMSAKNATCSPLNLSWFDPSTAYSNAWDFQGYSLPLAYPERDIYGTGGFNVNLNSDIAGINSDTVITSIDIDSIKNVYGLTWVKSLNQGTYHIINGTTSISNLSNFAINAGVNGEVITAISYLNHQPYYIAYSWDRDTQNKYDTVIKQATINDIGTTAENLSSLGYIITAIGGNYTDGFLVVGTKVTGDTVPRPISIINSGPWSLTRGFSVNGWIIIHGNSYLTIGQQ